jgi:L-amino acid N-acyltransferase YncA
MKLLKMSIVLRSAEVTDIPSINAIHKYYVTKTVITFRLIPSTDDEALKSYESVLAEGLPYIVAVDGAESIIGFAYAHGFRSGKGGYSHTVEFTLFCHPEQRGKGTGTALLKKLIEVLKAPEKFPEFVKKPRSEEYRVRQMIGCMALDETGPKAGLGLKEFYGRFGFEEVGHLKKVGYKLDRWSVKMPLFLHRNGLSFTGSIPCTCSYRYGRK